MERLTMNAAPWKRRCHTEKIAPPLSIYSLAIGLMFWKLEPLRKKLDTVWEINPSLNK